MSLIVKEQRFQERKARLATETQNLDEAERELESLDATLTKMADEIDRHSAEVAEIALLAEQSQKEWLEANPCTGCSEQEKQFRYVRFLTGVGRELGKAHGLFRSAATELRQLQSQRTHAVNDLRERRRSLTAARSSLSVEYSSHRSRLDPLEPRAREVEVAMSRTRDQSGRNKGDQTALCEDLCRLGPLHGSPRVLGVS